MGVYRLRARLGASGMGQVFLGYSPAGRAVAVKVIHRELARDPEGLSAARTAVAPPGPCLASGPVTGHAGLGASLASQAAAPHHQAEQHGGHVPAGTATWLQARSGRWA